MYIGTSYGERRPEDDPDRSKHVAYMMSVADITIQVVLAVFVSFVCLCDTKGCSDSDVRRLVTQWGAQTATSVPLSVSVSQLSASELAAALSLTAGTNVNAISGYRSVVICSCLA